MFTFKDCELNIYFKVWAEVRKIRSSPIKEIQEQQEKPPLPLPAYKYRGDAVKIKAAIAELNNLEQYFTVANIAKKALVSVDSVRAFYESNNIYGKWFIHPR